jgi:hypothetical protein
MVGGGAAAPKKLQKGEKQMARANKSARNKTTFIDKKPFTPDRANSERVARFHKSNGDTKWLSRWFHRHLERIDGQPYRKI